MTNCCETPENTLNQYNLALPPNLRYLVIDIGQKHNPIFPPNEEYSFHVLFLEPLIKIASNFVDASPGRMTVLACAVGSSHGVKAFSLPAETTAAALMSFGPKRAKNAPSQRSVVVPKLPLAELIAAVPKGAEVFVRVDEQNLSLAEAERSLGALERVSLFKKKIVWGEDGDKRGEKENKGEMNQWIALMKRIGFRLVKIDVIERGHEIAWVNPNPKVEIAGEQRLQSFLLQTHEEPKVIKVKNYVKITFKTFFFDDEAISVYRGADNFEKIEKSKAVWRLISPDSFEYPADAFKILASAPTSAQGESPKTLYISHSFFKGGLHCGYSEDRKPGESNFCWSRYQLINNSFRVLCGGGLEWVPPAGAVIPKGAVVGGRENTGEELFVTKTEKNGAVFIGKVCATWMIVENAEKRLKCQYYDGKTKFTNDFVVLIWKE